MLGFEETGVWLDNASDFLVDTESVMHFETHSLMNHVNEIEQKELEKKRQREEFEEQLEELRGENKRLREHTEQLERQMLKFKKETTDAFRRVSKSMHHMAAIQENHDKALAMHKDLLQQTISNRIPEGAHWVVMTHEDALKSVRMREAENAGKAVIEIEESEESEESEQEEK